MTDQPLKGVVVVDFGIHGAVSACGKVLADWGADVIKVESLSGDVCRFSGAQLNLPTTEDDNIHWEMLNGNKRSITIDYHRHEDAGRPVNHGTPAGQGQHFLHQYAHESH